MHFWCTNDPYSEDTDQLASIEAKWSGFALFLKLDIYGVS